MTQEKCPICNTDDIDVNCEIIFNWKSSEKRGPYYTCILCWDDLGSILSARGKLPFSGNNLVISLQKNHN